MAWTYDVHNIIIIAPKRYTYEILWTVNNELPWITPASHHTSQLFRNHYAMIIPPCVRYCTAIVLLNIPICAVNSWFTFVRGDGYPSWGIPNYGTERRCFFFTVQWQSWFESYTYPIFPDPSGKSLRSLTPMVGMTINWSRGLVGSLNWGWLNPQEKKLVYV